MFIVAYSVELCLLFYYQLVNGKLLYLMATKKVLFGLFFVLSFSIQAFAQEALSDTLMKHIRHLASSRYEGRMAGTQGFVDAAQYVSDVLAGYGVQPYSEAGWVDMLFDVECNVVENASLSSYVDKNDVYTEYVLGRDFACASMTGRGYADAPVVFCGYGIDNSVFNEYAKVDARGKVVVVLTGVPSFLPQGVTENYLTLRDKARVARAHGAVALVAVNMSKRCHPAEVQAQMYCGEGPHLATFPILQATRRCGESLLAGETMSIDSVLQVMDSIRKPVSFHLDKSFVINVNAKYNPMAQTANVVGLLKGSDRRLNRELIVVGASLDHMGMQGETCLFPGADKNASAVASLLETARLLTQGDVRPGRSVLFVLFSGGEHRHIGSNVFVQTFPDLKWIDAFINVESVGYGDSLVVMGNGHYPVLHSIAMDNDDKYTQFAAHGFETTPKGDAVAFDKVGIPSITLATLNGSRYDHVPSDIPENIKRQNVAKTATLLYYTVLQLSNGDYQGRAEESRYIRFDVEKKTAILHNSDGVTIDAD